MPTILHGNFPQGPKKQHTFKVGDRVRLKAEFRNPKVDAKHQEGVVASLPSGPNIVLGGHILGNEMGVDTDGGGRAVSDVDRWEAV